MKKEKILVLMLLLSIISVSGTFLSFGADLRRLNLDDPAHFYDSGTVYSCGTVTGYTNENNIIKDKVEILPPTPAIDFANWELRFFPDLYFDYFTGQNGCVHVVDPVTIKRYVYGETSEDMCYNGYCSYSSNDIYIVSEYSIPHELGHFIKNKTQNEWSQETNNKFSQIIDIWDKYDFWTIVKTNGGYNEKDKNHEIFARAMNDYYLEMLNYNHRSDTRSDQYESYWKARHYDELYPLYASFFTDIESMVASKLAQ